MAAWLESSGKRGKAPDGNMILALAEKYGQAPQDVEQWDAYWLHRAWTLLVAESIDAERRRK